MQYEGKGLGAFSSEVFKEPRDLSSLNVSWLVLLLLLILLCSFMTTSLCGVEILLENPAHIVNRVTLIGIRTCRRAPRLSVNVPHEDALPPVW